MFQLKAVKKSLLTLGLLLLLPLQVIAYERPEYISPEVWEEAKPYLVPEDSGIKRELDRIFAKSRATLSQKALKEAGFKITKLNKKNDLLVAKHHDFHDYVLKIFTDDQIGVNELENFINRINGARLTQKAIEKYDAQRYFKVPRKYLYLLPERPGLPNESDYQRKNFVLVVQNMHLACEEYNESQWEEIPKSKLDLLNKIITNVGLSECVHIDNIPFCKDMRIAFLNTERYHSWPCKYYKLNLFLTEYKANYWKKITRQTKSSTSSQ